MEPLSPGVSREAAFQARPATVGMALRDYLAMSQDDFSAAFKGSPLKRTKRRGLLRNVCVALGNVGTPDDLPALTRAAARRRNSSPSTPAGPSNRIHARPPFPVMKPRRTERGGSSARASADLTCAALLAHAGRRVTVFETQRTGRRQAQLAGRGRLHLGHGAEPA